MPNLPIDKARSVPAGLPGPAGAVRVGMALGAAINIALIAYGVARFPSAWTASPEGPAGICAGIGIAAVYGLVGWFGAGVAGGRRPMVLRGGVRIGLIAGALFLVQMLAENLVPHGARENALLGLATFGLYFLLLFAAGFSAVMATHRAVDGPLTALWGALIASQIWFILLLVTYYAFLGTAREMRVLEADQVLADFARSGMSDLRAFIFQDYMGGGFFHSLLGPLLSLILGGLGGLAAKAVLPLVAVLGGGRGSSGSRV